MFHLITILIYLTIFFFPSVKTYIVWTHIMWIINKKLIKNFMI